LKSNTRVATDDRQTYTNAFITCYRKKADIILITKQLGLGLLIRRLPMWISWISIFRQLDFVDFVDFDF